MIQNFAVNICNHVSIVFTERLTKLLLTKSSRKISICINGRTIICAEFHCLEAYNTVYNVPPAKWDHMLQYAATAQGNHRQQCKLKIGAHLICVYLLQLPAWCIPEFQVEPSLPRSCLDSVHDQHPDWYLHVGRYSM